MMNTHELVSIERGLWLKPGPWISATALPNAWFVLPEPIGLTDRNAIARRLDELETGLEVADARLEMLTETTAVLIYRATSRQAPAGVRYLCSSTYVKGRRSWSLAHHQRTIVAPRESL